VTVEARVSAVGADGELALEIDERSMCRGCSGSCLWRRLRPVTWSAGGHCADLEVGRRVVVTVPAPLILAAALVLHGAPWAGLVTGALAGQYLTGTDTGTLVGAVIGMVLALAASRPVRARLEAATSAHLEIAPLP
jgi:positive regulator of sigma E activity